MKTFLIFFSVLLTAALFVGFQKYVELDGELTQVKLELVKTQQLLAQQPTAKPFDPNSVKFECAGIRSDGSLSCQFENHSDIAGAICLDVALTLQDGSRLGQQKVKHKISWAGKKQIAADKQFCTGIIRGNDIKTVSHVLTFNDFTPAEICEPEYSFSTSWGQICDQKLSLVTVGDS